MMDGSLMEDGKTPSSYEYNVDVTRRSVDMAHACGVSVEGAVAQCDGASSDANRTTIINTTILHQRTTLEGDGRAQHTSTVCSRAADSVEAAPGPAGVNMYKRV